MTAALEQLRRALTGTYEVEREIGKGGMATVYLATHTTEQRQVAVKVLEPELAGAVGHDRFLREIGIASTLTHPGIVAVQDSGEVDGLVYYVMPFVDGESLRQRLARDRQLPIDDALNIAIEVAAALHDAHAQGFIHRDIKPENILLSEGRALVADFGIARAVDTAGAQKLTQTGLAVGTPVYMSPEQGTADKVDARSDMYSLGCVLYEMLAGDPPFSGATAQVLLARHAAQDVPSVRVTRATLSPEIDAVIRRAMAKVPADRFSSMGEFAAALRGAPRRASDPTSVPTPVGTIGTTTAAPSNAVALPNTRRYALSVVAVALLAIAGFVGYRVFTGGGANGPSRVVVLPFRNLGTQEDAYFSEGVTEEITSRLSGIATLGVIARTSALQYGNTTKTIKQIGEELNVKHLITGSIQWDRGASGGPQVVVKAQVIRISDEQEIGSINETFALAQLLSIQGKVAQLVVDNLRLVLGSGELDRVMANSTDDMTAYDYFLRGNSFYNRSWERADVDSAIIMYTKATEQDANYALAWAQLGKTHTWKHRLGHDETPQRLAMARAAIDRAIELNPDLPETHIAQGLYHYWGEWDFDKAIVELTKARGLQPSNAWVHLQLGNIRRRQGNWQEAVQAYEKAGEFDPRFHIIWFNIGHVRQHIRQYTEADKYLDRALTLQPTFLDAYLIKTGSILGRTGDAALARQWLDSTAKVIPPERWRLLYGNWLVGLERTLYPSPTDRLARISAGRYGLDTTLALVARGEALGELGAADAARATLDSAAKALESTYARAPKVAWISGALGVVYALQHKDSLAVDAAKRAEILMSDALDGPTWIINRARVELLVGHTKEALDGLELALSIPSGVSAKYLAIDPAWKPLQNDPRFKALLAKGSPAPPNW